MKDFKKLALFTLSRKEQEEILPMFQVIRNQTWANAKENERLMELRDILLAKPMSGEIDVSQVDIAQLDNNCRMG